MTPMERRIAVDRYYDLLEQVRRRCGGGRRLADCHGRMPWPPAGVYWFFDPAETRESGDVLRVVRVGTHALTATSSTKLWTRLRAHRGSLGGSNAGGGNHRGSIFRLHVGTALLDVGEHPEAASTWGRKSSASREIRAGERALEAAVSRYIGALRIAWLDVQDRHDRVALEAGSIALLSNADRESVDPPSRNWLGHHADRLAIRRSGLWNVDHVDRPARGDVLELLERLL